MENNTPVNIFARSIPNLGKELQHKPIAPAHAY